MKKRSKRILVGVLIFFVIVLSIGFILPMFGGYSKSTDRKRRIEFLERLRDAVLENDAGKPNLYDAYKASQGNRVLAFHPFFLIIPSTGRRKLPEGGITSKEEFNKVSEYAIIRDTNDWWCIIELKYGRFGNYFMFIDKDGKIGECSSPLLPKQFEYVKNSASCPKFVGDSEHI